MKKYSKILICMVTIIFLVINLAMAYNLTEYWSLGEGDSWIYLVTEDGTSKEKTRKIEGIEMVGNVKTVKMIYERDRYACIALDMEGLRIYKIHEEGKDEIFTPPKIIFPNMDVGESKTIKEEGRSTQILLESTIDDVDIPAGKFSNCLKFSSITRWSKPSSGNYGTDDCTVWLAPGVGTVKESCVKRKYNAKTKEEDTVLVILELTSAVIDGKGVGQQ